MAFNGTGVHNRVHDWTQDLAGSIPVTASRMDAEHDDISSSLSNTICRDGQSTTTARIPFSSGVSAAAGSTSAVAYAQINDPNSGMYFPASDQWGLAAGGTTTLSGTATKITAAVAADFSGVAAPTTDDGAALGSTSQKWSDLFLASGAAINFNSGDVTVTHAANALAFAGASSGYTHDAAVLPATSDGAALGNTSLMWSDLFLASGGVINWSNGDVTVAHSANALAFVGASSGYTFDATVTAANLIAINDLTVTDDASIGGDLNVMGLITGRAPLLHVRNQQTAGTGGGGIASGDWRTRTINTTVTNEISGASIGSNQITLPAGTYWVEAHAVANVIQNNKLRLRNVTDGSTTIVGMNNFCLSTSSEQVVSMRGRIPAIASSKVFELQHYCSATNNTDGQGFAFAAPGEVEVYADVMIWKVA